MTSVWLPSVAATGLPGSMLEMPGHPLEAAEWSELVEGVIAERLAGLLLEAVESGSLPATDSQRESVIDLHVQSMATVLLLERCLLATVEALGEAGIPSLVLKGSAVAHLDYSNPSLRPFADVDILVRSQHFDMAVETLTSLGCARQYPEPRRSFDRRFGKGTSFTTPSGLELDLHRTFVMGPYGLSIDLEQLWEDPQAFTLGGQQLHGLSAEKRLLHACYHSTLGDVPPKLMPRRDIAEMLLYGDADTDRVLELARAWRAEAVLAHAVRSAWQTLSIADSLRLSSWAATYQTSERDQKSLEIYLTQGSNYTTRSLAAISALPRWRDRMSFMAALAWPQREYLDGRHRNFAARLRYGLTEAVRGRATR